MGRGGYRFGAGRPGWHPKVENLRSIDVRHWSRERILQPGCCGIRVWTDSDTGAASASIGYTADGESITLNFSMNKKQMAQRVPLLRTACGYGGSRVWFGCPFCRRRVAKLYVGGSGFACRQCYRLVYASQCEDVITRAIRAQGKLESRLDEFGLRPKGMHRRTYIALLRRIEHYDDTSEAALAQAMVRLGLIP